MTLLIKLSLFFLRVPLLEIELGLEVGEDDVDRGKNDFLGVVGGEGSVVGVAGVAGRGVVALVGVDGSSLGGPSPLAIPLLVLLTSSGLGPPFSSSFRVLEEEVPVEVFLGPPTGRAWVEGVSVCFGGSAMGGALSTVLVSFTGTMKSGAFRLEGVG